MNVFGGLAFVGSWTIPENPRDGGGGGMEMGEADAGGMRWILMGRSIARRVKLAGWYASIVLYIYCTELF
jgi:hypothetical protein